MVTKIIFTLAVIALVVVLVRFRQRPAHRPAAKPPTAVRSGWFKGVAIAVVVVMLAGSVVILYLHWRDSHQVLQVKVIDSRSGRVSEYQVYRGRLGERGFETLDGRRVTLAETERLEVAAAP